LPILPESLKYLECSYNNKLPYNNLDQYKKWFAITYPEIVNSRKFNL